jgi:tetratricopeptide (TPR) repeat protein
MAAAIAFSKQADRNLTNTDANTASSDGARGANAATTVSPEERSRIKKQLSDQAVRLAIGGRWEEAADINRNLLTLLGEEPETYNRLGKSLMEMGKATDARAAYARSLELDPTNTIAKRNLDKLATMSDEAGIAPSVIDTRIFLEESGKSVTAVLQAVEPDGMTELDAGDVVDLKVEGNAVNAHRRTGEYIGMVEPRVGLRLAKLIQSGNRYSAAVITSTGDARVMIRETYQDPSMAGRVSFPRTSKVDVRAYTRRGLLQADLDDLDFGDDEDEREEFEDEQEDRWTDTGDDGITGVGINVEPEDETYD